MFKTSWQVEKLPMKDDSENHSKGAIYPFGVVVKFHPISARDQSTLHQFGKKVLPGIFLGCALIAGENFERRYSDREELENLDASENYPRRINAKEGLIPKKGEESKFPIADGTAKVSRRDCKFREPTPRRDPTVECEGLSGELQGEPEESQPTESKDDAEARRDFSSIQGDFICRHLNGPRVQLHVPKEETFPIPLKYIDVTRSTHTNLNVMQEKRIDDNWNVDANRSFFQILGKDSQILFHWKKNLQRDIWGLEGDWQKIKRPLDQAMCGLKCGPKLVKSLRRERSKNGQTRSRNSIMLDDWVASIQLIRKTKNTKKIWRTRGEIWKCTWTRQWRGLMVPPAFRKVKRSAMHPTKFQKQSMLVQWKLMNPRGNVWNHLYLKVTKTTSQVKDTTQWHIKIWYTGWCLCRWQKKIRMQKQQWARNGRSSKRFQHGS